MNKELKNLIVLLSKFDLSPAKKVQIINFLGEDASIEKLKKSKIVDMGVLTSQAFEKIIPFADDNLIEKFIEDLKDKEVYLTTIIDNDYPQMIRPLPEAPLALYYKGDLEIANTHGIAIVGTRSPSNYGKSYTAKFARELAKAGLTIISGLAYGVDSIAHRNCLEVGGKTIAVLGGGFDNIYPSTHVDLANEIAKKGLLLSEYPPEKEVNKYSFPLRNRIIAGLSEGVLITEAGYKSGTIYTKDYGLDYGRNIYALPGNVDSLKSQLTNDIIKNGNAQLVTCSEDILADFPHIKPQVTQEKMNFDDLSDNENLIVSNIKKGVKNIDELINLTGININDFNTYLTTLEIKGIISRLPGGEVSLN